MYHIYISEPKYKNIVEHQRTATTCTILHLKATDTNNDATQSTPPAVKLEHRHSSPPAKDLYGGCLPAALAKLHEVCYASLLCFPDPTSPIQAGAPICNIVLQHFYCNMVDAIRATPQETLLEGFLLLWFLPLVLAGCCCQLVCFEFGLLRWSCRSCISKSSDLFIGLMRMRGNISYA